MADHLPVNVETSLERQRGLLTPNEAFYKCNNFPYPEPPSALTVDGLVERPITLGLADLNALKHRSLLVTLECAGNGRAFLDPPVDGEQWRLGAVGTAQFTGAMLAGLLAVAGADPAAVEAVFHGADGFARSLPVEVARHPDTLLVTRMNQVPLPREHGGPLRLVVPGWYGMASVKWLTRIELSGHPFAGHFQAERYVVEGVPLREMEVRAVITSPAPDSTVGPGELTVAGYAWTGKGQIATVELSDDGGASWRGVRLLTSPRPYAWTPWEATWEPPRAGSLSLLARATDSTGRVQPLEQRWNRLGYANNAALPYRLIVSRRA